MKLRKKQRHPALKNILVLLFLPIYYLFFSVPMGLAQSTSAESSAPAEKVPFVCPSELNTLVDLLLQDLPSYTNRVIQRARYIGNTEPLSYVLLTSRPEFEPLPLAPGRQSEQFSRSDTAVNVESDEAQTEQIFFTTLERTYDTGQPVKLQHYHWLFLTQTSQGWRMVMMFSRFSSYPANQAPSPPRNSSNGAIAQAIRLWLLDCRAGTVRLSQ